MSGEILSGCAVRAAIQQDEAKSSPPRRDVKAISFDEMKAETAKDLRAVADLFELRARAIEAGDMDVFYELITEEIPRWHDMLILRQADRAERRELTP